MAVLAVLAALALLGSLVGLVVVGLRYRAEQREGARVRALFSRYVSPPIVDELLRRKDPRLYSGRCVSATILVCRIWNFAGFAEALTPQESLRYLNEFFALAGTSIQKHRGMIDKFLDDGIIGVFGVPLEDPAAEEHALRAALDIVRLVDAMERHWRTQDRRAFKVGIGINSGDVIAGDAGFDERREFTVVGPPALLAARLQEATEELHAYVVASSATCEKVAPLFSLVPLLRHPLPGLRHLVDAQIVVGLTRGNDALSMPAATAFKHTTLEAAPAPERGAALPAAAGAVPATHLPSQPSVPAAQRISRMSPPPPDFAALPIHELEDPLAPLRPRRAAFESTTDIPFSLRTDDADGPMFPDPLPPPRRRATYDDRSGPPIELPPA